MIKKIKKFWVWYIGVIFSVFAFSVMPVFASTIIEQSVYDTYVGYVTSVTNTSVYQIFKLPLNATLTSVDLKIAESGGYAGTYVLKINEATSENDATGAEVDASDNVAFTAGASLATYTFTFASPVELTADTWYSFELEYVSGGASQLQIYGSGTPSQMYGTCRKVDLTTVCPWSTYGIASDWYIVAEADINSQQSADGSYTFPKEYGYQWSWIEPPLVFVGPYTFEHPQEITIAPAANPKIITELVHDSMELTQSPLIRINSYSDNTWATVDNIYSYGEVVDERLSANTTRFTWYYGPTADTENYFIEWVYYVYDPVVGENLELKARVIIHIDATPSALVTSEEAQCAGWSTSTLFLSAKDICLFFSIAPHFFEKKIAMLKQTLDTKFILVTQISNIYSSGVTKLTNVSTNAPTFAIGSTMGVSNFTWSPFASMANYMPTVRSYMGMGLILYLFIYILRSLPTIFKDHSQDSGSEFAAYSPKMNMTKKQWQAQPNVKSIYQSYAKYKGIK